MSTASEQEKVWWGILFVNKETVKEEEKKWESNCFMVILVTIIPMDPNLTMIMVIVEVTMVGIMKMMVMLRDWVFLPFLLRSQRSFVSRRWRTPFWRPRRWWYGGRWFQWKRQLGRGCLISIAYGWSMVSFTFNLLISSLGVLHLWQRNYSSLRFRPFSSQLWSRSSSF